MNANETTIGNKRLEEDLMLRGPPRLVGSSSAICYTAKALEAEIRTTAGAALEALYFVWMHCRGHHRPSYGPLDRLWRRSGVLTVHTGTDLPMREWRWASGPYPPAFFLFPFSGTPSSC